MIRLNIKKIFLKKLIVYLKKLIKKNDYFPIELKLPHLHRGNKQFSINLFNVSKNKRFFFNNKKNSKLVNEIIK
jgi:hypothetical protein